MTQQGPSPDNSRQEIDLQSEISRFTTHTEQLVDDVEEGNLDTLFLLNESAELSSDLSRFLEREKLNIKDKATVKKLRTSVREKREALMQRLEHELKSLLEDPNTPIADKQEEAARVGETLKNIASMLRSPSELAHFATEKTSGRLIKGIVTSTTSDIEALLKKINRKMLDGQDFDAWREARLAEIHVKKKRPSDKLKLLRACFDNFIDNVIPDHLSEEYNALEDALAQAFGNEYNRLVRVAQIISDNPEYDSKRKMNGLEQVQRVFLENEPPQDVRIDELFTDALEDVEQIIESLTEEGEEEEEDNEAGEGGAEIIYSNEEGEDDDIAPEGSWVTGPDNRPNDWVSEIGDFGDIMGGSIEEDETNEAPQEPLPKIEEDAPEETTHLGRPDLPGEEDGDGEATLEMDMPATLEVSEEVSDPDAELTVELDPPAFLGPADLPSSEVPEGEEKVNQWLQSRHEIFDRAENTNIPLLARIDGVCSWLKDYHSSFEGEVFSEKTNDDVEAAFIMGLKILLWTERGKLCLIDQVEKEIKEYIEENQTSDDKELEEKVKKKTRTFVSLLPRVKVQSDDEEWDLYKYKSHALGRKMLQSLLSVKEDDTITEELKVDILNGDKDKIGSTKWHEDIDRKIKNLMENIQDKTTKKIELSILQQELEESAPEGLSFFQQNALHYVLQIQLNDAFLRSFFDENLRKPAWHDTSAQQIRRPGTSRLSRRPFPDQTVLLNEEQKEGRQLEAFFEEAEAVGRLKKEIEAMYRDGNTEEQIIRLTEIRAVVDKLYAAEKMPPNDFQELCNLIEEKREELEGSAGSRLLLIGEEANNFERLRTTVQVMNPNGNIHNQLKKLDAARKKALEMFEAKEIEEQEYEELCDLILEKREELEGSVRSKKRKVRLAVAAVLVGLGVIGGNQLRPYFDGSKQPKKTVVKNTPKNGTGTRPQPNPGIIDPVNPGRGDTALTTSESVAIVESNTTPRELSQQEREVLERTYAMLNNFWKDFGKQENTETPGDTVTEPITEPEPPTEVIVHHPGVPERYTVETIQALMSRVENYLEIADNIEDPVSTYNTFFSDDFNAELIPGLTELSKNQLESRLANYEADRDAELVQIQNLFRNGSLAAETTQNNDVTLEDRNEGHRLMYESLRGSLVAMRRHLESIWKLQQIKTALEALPDEPVITPEPPVEPEPTPVTPDSTEPTTPTLTAEQQRELLEATSELLSSLWTRIGKGYGSSTNETSVTDPEPTRETTPTLTPEQRLAKAWEVHAARHGAVETALNEAIGTLRAELERHRADYRTELEAHQAFARQETSSLEATHRAELHELRENKDGLSSEALMSAEMRLLREQRAERGGLNARFLSDMNTRKIDEAGRTERMKKEADLLRAIRELETEKASDRPVVTD